MRTAKTDGVVRFTVSVPRDLAKHLDQMTCEKGYDNRSLAVADMIRARLAEHRQNYGNHNTCRHHHLGFSTLSHPGTTVLLRALAARMRA